MLRHCAYKRAEYATDSLKALQTGAFVLRIKRILGSSHMPSPIGRLPLMAEDGRPTGIQYGDAIEAAERGGNVDFEGRKVRVVSISGRTGRDTPYSARLDLDLGDRKSVV